MCCKILASLLQHIWRHTKLVVCHFLLKISVHQWSRNCHPLCHVQPYHLVCTFPLAVKTPSFQPNLSFLSCSKFEDDIIRLWWRCAVVDLSLHFCHHQCTFRQGWPIFFVVCMYLHPRCHKEVSATSTQHAKDLHDGLQLCRSTRSLLFASSRLSQFCPALDSSNRLLCIKEGFQSRTHVTGQTKEENNTN